MLVGGELQVDNSERDLKSGGKQAINAIQRTTFRAAFTEKAKKAWRREVSSKFLCRWYRKAAEAAHDDQQISCICSRLAADAQSACERVRSARRGIVALDTTLPHTLRNVRHSCTTLRRWRGVLVARAQRKLCRVRCHRCGCCRQLVVSAMLSTTGNRDPHACPNWHP